MPVWLAPVVSWLGQRFLHVLIYGAIILSVGFLLYSAFLKPTNNQKTTVQAGGVVNHYNEQAKYAPFSCARIVEEKTK